MLSRAHLWEEVKIMGFFPQGYFHLNKTDKFSSKCRARIGSIENLAQGLWIGAEEGTPWAPLMCAWDNVLRLGPTLLLFIDVCVVLPGCEFTGEGKDGTMTISGARGLGEF